MEGDRIISLTALKSQDGAAAVASVVALMLTVGLMACALPALRALRIHPADVLRDGG